MTNRQLKARHEIEQEMYRAMLMIHETYRRLGVIKGHVKETSARRSINKLNYYNERFNRWKETGGFNDDTKATKVCRAR